MNMAVRTGFDFSCRDWWEKLQAGQTPIASLPLDSDKARQAVALFNRLRLPDVPGKPRLQEAGGEWFRDIVRALFAAVDPETGAALINELFCLVPKKNNKTTGSAALGVIALALCDRPNAQMLILGPTQNVAERCFDQMAGMIDADPLLKQMLKVRHHNKTIERTKTGAELAVKTFDMNVVTGEIPAFTIIDELHIVAAKSYAQRVVAQITGGMITNADAKLVFITTQSDVPPMGVFKDKLDYARGVRDGTITEGVRMLPVLYEFPVEVQADESRPWRDPAMWPAVLPNLGLSVLPDVLRDKYLTARSEGAEAENIWASQHLNIQIGIGLHGDGWEGAPFWRMARHVPDRELDGCGLDDLLDACEVVVAGVDGGGLDDLAALTLVGRLAQSKRWAIWTHAWVHPEALEKRKAIAPRLQDFIAQGDLTLCARNDQDFEEMLDILRRVRDCHLFPEKYGIGLDAYGVAGLTNMLAEDGFAADLPVAVGQGWKLNSAIKTLPRMLKFGRAMHMGQPLLDWAVGNAKGELRGSNTIITKAASGSAKIDPVMAMFNAVQLMLANPVAARPPAMRIRTL